MSREYALNGSNARWRSGDFSPCAQMKQGQIISLGGVGGVQRHRWGMFEERFREGLAVSVRAALRTMKIPMVLQPARKRSCAVQLVVPQYALLCLPRSPRTL